MMVKITPHLSGDKLTASWRPESSNTPDKYTRYIMYSDDEMGTLLKLCNQMPEPLRTDNLRKILARIEDYIKTNLWEYIKNNYDSKNK